MSTEGNTICAQVTDFLSGNDQLLLIKGTYREDKQGTLRKAKLTYVMAAVLDFKPSLARIVFRTNNVPTNFLSGNEVGWTVRKAVVQNSEIYIDSFRASSWVNTPDSVDAAVLYPLESPKLSPKGGVRTMADLLERGAQKIILVPDVDQAFSWIDRFAPVIVTCDAPPFQRKRVN